MKIIKQTTHDTCLACALLMIVSGNKKDEIEIWKHGWNFNYLIGQLNYVSKKYNKSLVAYIENKYYFQELLKQKKEKVDLKNEKINLKLIEKMIKYNNIAVYVDAYYPYVLGNYHAPHFWVILKIGNDFVEVADPWYGKKIKMPMNVFKKAIISLRNHLGYSPVLITTSK
jgi:hypothetical protein